MLYTLGHELTHHIRKNSPEKFKAFADLVMENYGKIGVSAEKLVQEQIAKAKRNGRDIGYEEAYEDVIADSMEGILADGKVLQLVNKLQETDASLGEKVRKWFADAAEKIRSIVEAYKNERPDSTEGQMVANMKEILPQLEELYAEGIVDAGKKDGLTPGEDGNVSGETETKNAADDGGVKYSLREFSDGTRFVDIQMDSHTFDGMTISEMNKHAKKILMDKFAGRIIGIDNRVFVNGDSVNEYLHPSKSIDIQTRKAKLTASGELDNLLDAGTALPNEPDGKDGHIHPDAIDFSYFKTIFKVGSEYFEGIVNVKNIKRGKLLKDVTKIRNITKDIVSSYGQNPKSNFLRDASMDSIRNSDQIVNNKTQKKLSDWDLESTSTDLVQSAIHDAGVKYSERDFTYKELTAKSDLKGNLIKASRTVKLLSDGSIDSHWVVSEVFSQCKSVKTNSSTLTYYVSVPDIGKNVQVTSRGIGHGFIKFQTKNGKTVPKRSMINARVALDLPNILSNSIEVNRSSRGNNLDVDFTHILLGVTALENANGNVEYYAVRSVVESRKNQDAILVGANILGKLHAVNAKK